MSLIEDNLFGHIDKVQKAIDRLKAFCPEEGYYVAFSGGKDSQCVYHLCEMAGVKFDAHYSVTGVDPPELMRFVKRNYPSVEWDYHREANGGKPLIMWNLIEQHTTPPTRQLRYCCNALKECSGDGRVTVTGVRWAESIRRRDTHGIADMRTQSKKLIREALETNDSAKLNKRGSLIFMDDNEESRRMVESCYRHKRTTINPIIDWTDDEVWEFLNDVAQVQHCDLYDEGFMRLGCIGCPLAGRKSMEREFERWPRYKELYIRAFDRMLAAHPGKVKVADGAYAAGGGGQIFTKWMEWNR